MSDVALIAIDWGTSSFRAWQVSTDGGVVAEITTPLGIMAVQDKAFDAAFESLVGPWLDAIPAVPVIASGMITSRTGWVETPYVQLPIDAGALARALVRHVTDKGRIIHFVTGAAVDPGDGLPDVMRGEETEIAGLLATSDGSEALIVLPGTHSKWVSATGKAFASFETYMTGEIYSVMLGHSTLGRLMTAAPPSPDSFRKGVDVALTDGSIIGKLFSARSLVLFDRLEPAAVGDYLSGLLIGEEVRAGLARHGSEQPITVIGRGDLVDRYITAFSLCGVAVRSAEPGMARTGLVEIARQAGLLA
jgi:2-dehydro-3-deoxygalactonokinase